jgi:hypothetical protein
MRTSRKAVSWQLDVHSERAARDECRLAFRCRQCGEGGRANVEVTSVRAGEGAARGRVSQAVIQRQHVCTGPR